MNQTGNTKYDLNDERVISVIDDVPLWSAPFGLKLLDSIEYKKNITCLDIGTGTGFPLIEVAMRLGNSSKLFGIDPWNNALKRVKEKIQVIGIKNIELLEGNAENMPFPDNHFDLIFSNNGINNVNDMAGVIQECHRTCKPKGRFIFTMNLENSMIEFYEVFKTVLEENNLGECIPDVEQHILQKRKPLNETEKILENAGFVIQHIDTDMFVMKYADATSFLNHFLIQLGFRPEWEKLIPYEKVHPIFLETEERLDADARMRNGLNITIPYVLFNCVNT
jgi:arsenite methyltransferase